MECLASKPIAPALHATRSALQTGLDEALPTLAEMIEDAKDSAATAMETARSELDPIWAFWGNSYFAQHSVNEIVWHTNSILASMKCRMF